MRGLTTKLALESSIVNTVKMRSIETWRKRIELILESLVVIVYHAKTNELYSQKKLLRFTTLHCT